MTGTEDAAPVGKPGTGRGWIVAATVIGTTIEWYDFFIICQPSMYALLPSFPSRPTSSR